MISDTLDGLLQALVDELDFITKSIVIAPGDSVDCSDCTNPVLAGTMGTIERVTTSLTDVAIPPVQPRRRAVELSIKLSQCIAREASKATDISGTTILDRIELTDNAIYCAVTNGFTVYATDGDDTTVTGQITSMIPSDSDACQVTTWTVLVGECLEECE